MFHRVKSEVQDDVAQDTKPQRPLTQKKTPIQEPSVQETAKVSPAKPATSPTAPKAEAQSEERLYTKTPAKYESRSVSRYTATPANAPSVATPYASLRKTRQKTTPTSNPQPQDTKTMTNTADKNATEAQQYSASSYAGSAYPGSSAYRGTAKTKTKASTNTDGNRTLTIGQGITMSGEIESCDYLLVEGTVEAALRGARTLEIAETGMFYGTVDIEEANIAGRFEGDITVGRLVVASTGTITGSITYAELELETGAIIDGRLTPASAVARAEEEAPLTAPAKTAPKAKKEKAQPAPANSDGELFEDAESAA